MTNPSYESQDGRGWITDEIEKKGGARKFFKARFLEPHQLDGINDPENYVEGRANRRDEDDNRR